VRLLRLSGVFLGGAVKGEFRDYEKMRRFFETVGEIEESVTPESNQTPMLRSLLETDRWELGDLQLPSGTGHYFICRFLERKTQTAPSETPLSNILLQELSVEYDLVV
jgi:hypothetical protein